LTEAEAAKEAAKEVEADEEVAQIMQNAEANDRQWQEKLDQLDFVSEDEEALTPIVQRQTDPRLVLPNLFDDPDEEGRQYEHTLENRPYE
jgi:hypothetical protein